MTPVQSQAAENTSFQVEEIPRAPAEPGAATLVLGLGNPLLGDDGAGWKIVSTLQDQMRARDIEFDCLDCSGLALMERLVGYRQAILVDAVTTGSGPLGQVQCLSVEELGDPSLGHLTSAHDTSLRSALELARELDLPLPSPILVIGIEVQPSNDCSARLSGPVEEAVPQATEKIRDLLASLRATAGRGVPPG